MRVSLGGRHYCFQLARTTFGMSAPVQPAIHLCCLPFTTTRPHNANPQLTKIHRVAAFTLSGKGLSVISLHNFTRDAYFVGGFWRTG